MTTGVPVPQGTKQRSSLIVSLKIFSEAGLTSFLACGENANDVITGMMPAASTEFETL